MRKKICNRFDQGGFTAPICTEDSNDRFWGDEKADIFYDLFSGISGGKVGYSEQVHCSGFLLIQR